MSKTVNMTRGALLVVGLGLAAPVAASQSRPVVNSVPINVRRVPAPTLEEVAPPAGEPAAPDVPRAAGPIATGTAPAPKRDDVPVRIDNVRIDTERDAYTVEYYPLPDDCVLEVGGMDFTSDGRLFVSTRRGQVWVVENPLEDDISKTRVKLFHEGLWEGLGLDIVDDRVYVLQRGELSRLDDVDGDGKCDSVVTIADDWGVSGHYHEFAFGLPRSSDDRWFIGLNVSFGHHDWWHGRSMVPYRGWIMRVSPDGTVEPWAHGLRSPNGVALDSQDRLFVTDNQGDWVASSPIYHVVEGGFYGHPKSLNWTPEYRAAGKVADDEIPPAEGFTGRQPAAIWIPYEWSRSTGNLFEDRSGGRFGLEEGQFVVAELTNGMLLRAGFEEVQGVTQGWVTPLVREIGSINRVIQAPDGSTLCGFTNRGWGGLEPPDGLARVRFKGATPMEIGSLRIVDVPAEPSATDADEFGFELTLSRPVAEGWAPSETNVRAIQYDYDYWWEYGSPERHTQALEFASATLSEDRRTLRCRFAGMLPAMCVRLTLEGVTAADGSPLLHPTISYTVNQLPSGPTTGALVAKVVPPPPSRNDGATGVLHLSWGDPMQQFESEGWELGDVRLSEGGDDLVLSPGSGALVNVGAPNGEGSASDYATKADFGDVQLSFDFLLPEGGRSALELGGGGSARIELVDDAALCGGIAGTAPRAPAYLGKGQWTKLEVWYTAATDDAPARIDRVDLAGVTVQENVEVTDATVGRARIRFVGHETRIALRDIRAKPLDRPADGAAEWTFLDPADDWGAWGAWGDARFDITNEGLVGRGALGHLWAPAEDLGDVTVRFRAQVNANGAGAVIVRANEGEDGRVEGYAVRLNASFPDKAYFGSIDGGGASAPVRSTLVTPDTWTDVEIDVRNQADGSARIVVRLNGVVVNELVDETPLPPGGIVFRSDHDGSISKLINLRYRE